MKVSFTPFGGFSFYKLCYKKLFRLIFFILSKKICVLYVYNVFLHKKFTACYRYVFPH